MKLINPNTIIVHHSVTPQNQPLDSAVKAIDVAHKARLHPTKNSLGYHIAYHFIVAADGSYEQTRGYKEVGHHAGVWTVNLRSFAICLLGNFQKDIPTDAQLLTVQDIMADIQETYNIKDVKAHRDIKATACCGKNMTDDLIWQLAEGTYGETPPDWSEKEWNDATSKEYVNGERPNDIVSLYEEEIIMSRIINPRTKKYIVSKTEEPMTRARFVKIIYDLTGELK